MADELEQKALSRLLAAHNDFKHGRITKEEVVSRFYKEAGVLEEAQWKIIGDLRTKAPELADALKKLMREGSGNA